MTTKQAILKCQKKAWREIKHIQNASNMLTVLGAMSDAIEKTFGMWDRGVYMIGMKKLGAMGVLEGERVIRIRRSNHDKHVGTVRAYLIEFIPDRMFNSTMYKRHILGMSHV